MFRLNLALRCGLECGLEEMAEQMGFELHKLGALKVARLQRKGRYGDGGGLWLQVTDTGTKSWLFRYKREGRGREMGLGALSDIGLAEARLRAQECRRLLHEGKDPLEERAARRAASKAAAAKGVTFQECAQRYISAHEDTWKHPKHRQQWKNTLESYVYPIFGAAAVGGVDVGMVLKAIEPIWSEKPETAARVRMRIETVLDWATVRGYRVGDNPARWRGHLDKMLPARKKVKKVRHHPALPYGEIGDFVAELRKREGVAPRALEFLILNASRTSEVIEGRWSEIDLKAAIWTIAAERMKSGREHRVPLSKRAIAILEALPRDKRSEFIFVGDRRGSPLSNMAMLKQLARMKRSDITVHGFRSTFRDWCAEQTNFPREVAEMALAHVVDDKTEAAYRRGDLFEKRRRLAEDWAEYCGRKSLAKGAVVPIRGVITP